MADDKEIGPNTSIESGNKDSAPEVLSELVHKVDITENKAMTDASDTVHIESTGSSNFRSNMLQHVKLWSAVIVWYGLNVTHIMTSKSFLNALPLPWTVCSFEFLVGWLFAGVFWGTGFRKMPRFPNVRSFISIFIPLGLVTVFLHCGTIISMALGSVSFTTVIKSAEPVATAVLSILILKDYLNIYVYLSLIPIVAGVAISSANELSFNTWSFFCALASNVFEAFRAIIVKKIDFEDETIGTNLTPTNIYMLFTLVASCICLPISLGIEAPYWKETWLKSTAEMTTYNKGIVIFQFIACGFLYYVYNDFAFYCLGLMNQVTYSVLNTMKRIVVIIVSIIIFQNEVNVLGYVGISTAIIGGLLYSLAKQGICSRPRKQEVALE
ncbi:Triose-phosphate Transporter family protein [Babesia bovis T2Bo]|uniref:Triose or hexose phosphate/phosphate translocator, putative n=1 Tax=Babesia bovis TaxID=5865 RepID=A7AX00_BABBO|nr:Triose-phosphate Transporter family protein [Babesia bovis T2Bo]EDO05578.1 Triose-phosphate Transporter family protein [Babesia bovis T2Bo]|eukprot:XP_001609146.1 triose or hexose phosphate/phosphate translocator [Babesia bovis T2Bo]